MSWAFFSEVSSLIFHSDWFLISYLKTFLLHLFNYVGNMETKTALWNKFSFDHVGPWVKTQDVVVLSNTLTCREKSVLNTGPDEGIRQPFSTPVILTPRQEFKSSLAWVCKALLGKQLH